MKIHGDSNNLHAIQPDTYIYLLMKRLTYLLILIIIIEITNMFRFTVD